LEKKYISNTKIELEIARKAFLKFWGGVGYSKYDLLLKNNINDLSEEKLLGSIRRIIDLEKRSIHAESVTEEMAQNLNEKIFNEVMEWSLSENIESGVVAMKAIDGAVDSIEKILPNRWMSFTVNPKLNYQTVISEPESFVQNDSYFEMAGSDFGISYIIISLPLGFKYVDTTGLCDTHEVLINSNEILRLQNQLKMEIININDLGNPFEDVSIDKSSGIQISKIINFVKNIFY
jgi:hypothetical protein